MATISDLSDRIDVLRSKLLELIDEKEDLLDNEVLAASILLDEVIADYNELDMKIKNAV